MEKKEFESKSQFNLAQNKKRKIVQLINLKKFVIALKKSSNQQQRQIVKQNIKQIIKKLDTHLDKTEWKILHQYITHQLRAISQQQDKLHKQDIAVKQQEGNQLITYFIKVFQHCLKLSISFEINKSISIFHDVNVNQQILIQKSKTIIKNLINLIQIGSQNKNNRLTQIASHEFQILLIVIYNLSQLYKTQQRFKLSIHSVQIAQKLCLQIIERQKQENGFFQISNKISKFYNMICEHKCILEQKLHIQNIKNKYGTILFTKSFPFKDILNVDKNKNKFMEDILIYCKQQKKISLKDYYNISLFFKKTKKYQLSLAFFQNIILNFQTSQKMINALIQDLEVFQIFFNSYLHMADIFNKLQFTKWSRSVLQQLIYKLDKLFTKKIVWNQKLNQLKIKKCRQIEKYLSKLSLIQKKQKLLRKNGQDSNRFQKISLNSYRIKKIKQKQVNLNNILNKNIVSMPISNVNSYKNSPQKSYHAYKTTKSFKKKIIRSSKPSKNNSPSKTKQNLNPSETIFMEKTIKNQANINSSRKNILSKSNKNLKYKINNMVSIKNIEIESTKIFQLNSKQLQQMFKKKQQQISKNIKEKNFKQALFRSKEFIRFLDNCFKESQKKNYQKYQEIKKIVYQKKINLIQYFQSMNKLFDIVSYIKDLLLQIKIFKKNDIYLRYRQFLTSKLAQCYKKNNQAQLAINTYQQLAKNGNHEAFAKIGQIYLQFQNFLQAIKYFEKYCIQKQFSFQSKVKLAQAYSKIPQYCLKAIDMLNNILLKCSNHSSPIQFVNLYQQQFSQQTFEFATLLLSNLYRNAQNIQKAIKICQQYINIMPLSCNIRYAVGNYYCQKGDIKKGFQSYLDILKIDPSHHQSLLMLVNFVHQNQNYRTQIIGYLSKMIFNANNKLNYYNANDKLNYQILKYLAAFIDNKAALKIGQELSVINLIKCVQIIQKTVENNKQVQSFDLNRQITKIYLFIQQMIQTQQVESIIQHQYIYFKLGEVYFRQGNFKLSQKYLIKNMQIINQVLFKQAKENFNVQKRQNMIIRKKEILIKLGNLKEVQLRYEQALNFYKEANSIQIVLSHKTQIQLLILLANCHFQLKQYQQAKNYLEQALNKLDKVFIDLQNIKDFKSGSNKSVSQTAPLEVNKQQIVNQHTKAIIRLKIAFCYDKQQDFLESKQIYRQILRQLPQHNEISDICVINLANIYLLSNEDDKYIEQIESLLTIRPQRDDLRRQLIQVYRKKGMFQQAQRHEQQKNKNYRIVKILNTIRNLSNIQNDRIKPTNQTSICNILHSQTQFQF